jgi:hypothetical protein
MHSINSYIAKGKIVAYCDALYMCCGFIVEHPHRGECHCTECEVQDPTQKHLCKPAIESACH